MRDYDRSVRLRATLLPLFGGGDYSSSKLALAEAYIGRALVHTVNGYDIEAQRDLGQATGMGIDLERARAAIAAIKAQR